MPGRSPVTTVAVWSPGPRCGSSRRPGRCRTTPRPGRPSRRPRTAGRPGCRPPGPAACPDGSGPSGPPPRPRESSPAPPRCGRPEAALGVAGPHGEDVHGGRVWSLMTSTMCSRTRHFLDLCGAAIHLVAADARVRGHRVPHDVHAGRAARGRGDARGAPGAWPSSPLPLPLPPQAPAEASAAQRARDRYTRTDGNENGSVHGNGVASHGSASRTARRQWSGPIWPGPGVAVSRGRCSVQPRRRLRRRPPAEVTYAEAPRG